MKPMGEQRHRALKRGAAAEATPAGKTKSRNKSANMGKVQHQYGPMPSPTS